MRRIKNDGYYEFIEKVMGDDDFMEWMFTKNKARKFQLWQKYRVQVEDEVASYADAKAESAQKSLKEKGLWSETDERIHNVIKEMEKDLTTN